MISLVKEPQKKVSFGHEMFRYTKKRTVHSELTQIFFFISTKHKRFKGQNVCDFSNNRNNIFPR